MSAFSLRLAFTLAVSAALPLAHAGSVYSTSFENPPFTTGPIAGQDGWNVFGPGISTVEGSFALTGSQAVFVDGSTATQSGPYHSDSVVGNLIDVSADIAIFSSSVQSEWQFGALGPGLAGFLGGIDILPDNSILAISSGFPVLGSFPRAGAFDSSAWHHIDLLFNMSAQTYDVSLDGSTLRSGITFCGDNGPCAGAAVPAYGAAIFDTFGAETSPLAPPNDSGYMDNFQVSSVAAPEPSTILLLAAGLAGLGVRLRRKSSRVA